MNKEIYKSGKKVSYNIYGKGKPVMLVHGFGETGDVWKNQIEFLEKKFFLIVPDLPGSGKSEMIEEMSMEGMAEVLKTIMDNEIFQSSKNSSKEVSLIGHSMGGYITLAFAEKYESLLSSFGLFHSSAFADSQEKIAARRKGIDFIKENGAFEFLKTATPNLFSPKTKEERPTLVNEFLQSLSELSPGSLVAYYEAMIKRPDRTHVLKNFTKPILFIMGEHDNAIPMQDVLKQTHLPQKAHIHILHQSGHMGMLEETDKGNQLLKEFLESV